MLSSKLNTNNFIDYVSHFFDKRGKDFVKSFSTIILGMMHSCSCSTWAVASSIAMLFDKSFKAGERQISYLFANNNFKVDDQLWRCYLQMIFAILSESSYIKTTEKIFIQIDHTTIKDDFLIMYASIVFNGKSLPIYFTKRSYPKRKNQMSRLKMERAFINGLRHCLSKKYQYVIVADRGFGTDNFTQACIENGFDFIVRLKENLNIDHVRYNNLKHINRSTTLTDVRISSWQKNYTLIIKKIEVSTWYLCTNINDISRKKIIAEYARRFKIEKCFFEQKSNGFDIESTKIRKYDRIGRMLFCVCVSHAIMLIVGNIIKHNHHVIKKNFPQNTNLILALLPLRKN